MSEKRAYLWFRYTFSFDDGVKRVFEARLDPKTLIVIPPAPARAEAPDWTRLEDGICANCQSRPDTTPYCPIARNMTDVVESFADILSYQEADVLVETAERDISKRVPVQSALSSLIGIYMAASGCPVMDGLKPLVRFHLPFASIEETNYRVLSMYVTAQYLRMKSGLVPDWELVGLTKMYEEVHKVNVGFCRRLQGAIKEDSLINSVTGLDVFAHMGQAPAAKMRMRLNDLFEYYLAR